MLQTFLYPLLFTLAAIYAARVSFFAIGVLRERRRWRVDASRPTVSIVIPARNEERTIERCVQSILRSNYPADRFEVVVVNDRSTDSTATILDRLAAADRRVKVLHRKPESALGNLQGKAGALQYGVAHCTGDVVLFTDADCTVTELWVLGMAMQFASPNLGLITGITTVAGTRFFTRAQDVEWIYTQTMACGGVGNGVPLGCFGNNMAVRRDAFNAIGGYANIPFSVTEDLALQFAMFRAGYEIRHAIHSNVQVQTMPCSTFVEYVKQRHRWVRGGTALGISATAFVISSIALWAGIIVSAVYSAWVPFWGFVAMRLMADSGLVAMSAIYIKRYRLLPMIVPAMALLVLTELFIPFLVARKQVTWKGQVFRS